MEARSGSSPRPKFRWSLILIWKTKNHCQLLPEATSTRPTHGPMLNPMSLLNTMRQSYPKGTISYPKDPMPYPKGPTSYPKGQSTNRELHQAWSGLLPNPDSTLNSSSPTPSTIEAPLRLQFLFGSSKQELHHPQAEGWRRPLKSPTGSEQLSIR